MYQDTKDLMSDTKFYEAYSRYNNELNRYETWDEAVDRVMDMHKEFYRDKMNTELVAYIDEASEAYHEKRVLGAQRALQFGGEQLLRKNMKLYNCTSSYADRAEFFGEMMWILLCGSGAGFSVQKQHINKLPKIHHRNKQPKTYVVEDSIEGWASAVDVLLSSYFENGGKHPDYVGRRIYFDLSLIRPKGSMISGGFKAPGPDPLRRALDRIEYLLQGLVLDAKKPVALRPIHVYDIVMHCADAVLSGGVRRSATICLFSFDDSEMAKAKTGNWFQTNPQRARSNNSAVINRKEIKREEFHSLIENIKEFGEPGFFFVDDLDITTNPCVEIGMYPKYKGESGWQGCNLTEINGSMCVSEAEFLKACRAASILGTLQAGYTEFDFLSEASKKIFEREALLGVSITGWMNNPGVLFDEKILKKGAETVKEINKAVAKIIGINQAARTTCVKPSGTTSVILQTASGIHAEHSPMYIRNVQLNKDTEVAETLKKSNPYMVEESVWSANKSDYVVSFPIIAKSTSLFKNELHGVKHLEYIKKAQMYWVNAGTNEELCVNKFVRHNVSNTIIVDDWDEVEEYVFNNREFFAGISFISESGDKIFEQAPNTKVIDSNEIVKKYGTGSMFASGLIVDGLKAFNNSLWTACSTARGNGENIEESDDHIHLLKKDWVRRFHNFTVNYFDNDAMKAEHCLKDVYLLHKWEKIQQNLEPVNWSEHLSKKRIVDVDTLGAAACYAGACEI